MSRSDPPSSMFTKSDTASSSSRPGLPSATTVEVPAEADPSILLAEIRELITDHLFAARQLATEAAARFPEHDGIRNADRILNRGNSRLGSGGPAASREKEIEWLQDPPDSVHGQWVALLGSELVGSAETLAELVEILRSKNLEKRALVHRIDE